MLIEFDPDKDRANLVKHGVSLATAGDFEMDTAIMRRDARYEYGEARIVAIGLIGDRVHVLVFTMRGETVRVISLRKANRREVFKYVVETQDPYS
ncbi:hypothetical protein LMG23992_02393 [Cupriavidus laharis]|uniref:BrnT family toxin n=1 Tax=Cupriavidus laharis TaxID=151654 RepID=A0ABN7YKT8_9BURK|nr:BrnT family toxin [Cupriavidus laharis]CAG9173011.1 hypothetical protein LMG23992_02393 [Cupriavidus laharis]